MLVALAKKGEQSVEDLLKTSGKTLNNSYLVIFIWIERGLFPIKQKSQQAPYVLALWARLTFFSMPVALRPFDPGKG